MQRKIIFVIIPIVAILSFFWLFKSVSAPSQDSNNSTQNEATSTNEQQDSGSKVSDIIAKIFPASEKDIAWDLFQKYLLANKEHDLNGVKSMVYKMSPVCEQTASTTECFARMDSAYAYGSGFKKEDFIYFWHDDKQMIFASDYWTESSESIDLYGRFRSIIFFIKNNDGQWQILSWSPTKGGAVNKGKASQREIDDRLIRYTEDNDNDGMADYDEECLSAKEGETCVKTNPKLRDTDLDGYWDGVEALIDQY